MFASKLEMRLSWQLTLWPELVLRSLDIMVGLRDLLNRVRMNGNIRVSYIRLIINLLVHSPSHPFIHLTYSLFLFLVGSLSES